jgi:hypothetical protein
MELKTTRLTLLIDPNKKVAFERLCARQDRTASQVVRQLIRDYLAQHGIQDTASGLEESQDELATQVARAPAPAPAQAKPNLKRAAPSTSHRSSRRR